MSDTWDFPDPHLYQDTVVDHHIDELGHTNNAVYTQWCQHSAWLHSGSLGLDSADYNRLKRAMAIQHASYDYIAPCYLGDKVVVATWLTQCDGKLRMERRFQINTLETNSCLFRGTWQLVCINPVSYTHLTLPTIYSV